MKSRKSRDEEFIERGERVAEGDKKKKMKKNMQRLGGGGLSLDVFANAKSRNTGYNPALLKRKREFYKNAKHVNKYKKLVKQQSQKNDSSSVQPVEENKSRDSGKIYEKSKEKGKESYSLKLLYEKKHEDDEKARMGREAITKAKKEEQQRAEARRKDLREKMLKKTRKGQPIMKYRIEYLLETLQAST